MSQSSAECEVTHSPRGQRDGRLRVVRIGLLGYGRVGQAFAGLVRVERRRFAGAGLDLRCVSALVRDPAKPRTGPDLPLFTNLTAAWRGRIDLVVEVMGGVEPAATFVAAALRSGVPVVSANKSLVAAHGAELRAAARACATTFACEAAVLAGVPFLGSLIRRPLFASARRVEGVLNGTSHFILSEMDRGVAFGAALETAIARGYAEPDSGADITGRDAAEKLAILLQIAGCRDASPDRLPRLGIDCLEPADLAAARRAGGAIKPVAVADLDPRCPSSWIGPAFVDGAHPFARLDEVDNALRLTSSFDQVVTFTGPGAGPRVTAATLLDDAIETLERGTSRSGLALTAVSSVKGRDLVAAPTGEWWLRVAGSDSITTADLGALLAARGTGILHVAEAADRLAVRVAAMSPAAVRDVARLLELRGARVLALPVLAGGRHE